MTAAASAAHGEGEVYVLVSQFDCVGVEGVYATLEAAQQAAATDAEQDFTWTPYNRGEASHRIPPFSQWFSSKGDIDGDPIQYVIWQEHVRTEPRP